MNSKPTNKPAKSFAKGNSRPAPAKTGQAPRPAKKTTSEGMYGRYREDAPAAKPAAPPPAGRPPALTALTETLRAVTAELKALKADAAQKDTEIKALQKRLTQMEARQKAQEKALRAARPDQEPPRRDEADEEQSAPLTPPV